MAEPNVYWEPYSGFFTFASKLAQQVIYNCVRAGLPTDCNVVDSIDQELAPV